MNSRLAKFLSYYRPYRGLVVFDFFGAVIVAATALALPLCARYITETVLAETTPDTLNHIYAVGGLMLGLIALHTAANWVVDYRGHSMGALMESDMRAELFDHYQKLSFSFYDEQHTGQLMSRLTNGLFWMSELAHHGLEDFAISALKFVGAFIILIQLNAPLTVIVFLFLPFMAAYAFTFNRRMNRALRATHERVGDINAQLEDTLSGIRVVKSFTNETVERRKFAQANARFVRARQDGYRGEAYFSEGIIAFTELMTAAVILVGGILITRGALSLPDLVTFLMSVAILIDPIHRAVNFTRLYQEGMTGFARFMEIMEVQPDIQDAPDAIDVPEVKGSIEFKNVSFKYRDDHDYVLKDISLTITAGEYVALVGSSGVGKTTLCSLIPRFYEATGGDILIDGVNIRQMTQRSLRQQIGVVQQDVYLFAGTVADNIRYGKLDATDAEVVAAARQANAHDFIMALPDGYATDVGQRGVKLSGGQKQRLSIARVFLKNPPIIIFDEATSALDNESEKAVQASLEQLADQRTMLVIAHRLTTIRNAGRIIVLTDSGIHEQGTHDELIALEGIYANLYHMHLRS